MGYDQTSGGFSERPYRPSAAFCFLFFSLACFFTAFVATRDFGAPVTRTFFTDEEGMLGPVEVKRDKTVYRFEARHQVNWPQWSRIMFEVQNDTGEQAFGFYKEFWCDLGGYGSGVCGEGTAEVEAKFTIRDAGIYYMRVTSENNLEGDERPIYITLARQGGSTLPFVIAGVLSLLICLLAYALQQVNVPEYGAGMPAKRGKESGTRNTTFPTGLVVALLVIYLVLLNFGHKGWGYRGYWGYGNRSVFFYPERVTYYTGTPSLRNGSVTGPRHEGGGMQGGK